MITNMITEKINNGSKQKKLTKIIKKQYLYRCQEKLTQRK